MLCPESIWLLGAILLRRLPVLTKKQTWAAQFAASLGNWAKKKDKFKDQRTPDDFLGSLDAVVDGYLTERKDEMDDLCILALRALVHQKIESAFREIEQSWGTCESPIEVALLFTLPIVARELGWAVILRCNRQTDGDRDDFSPDILTIESQAQLGEHRVDFLLSFRTSGPDFDRPVKGTDGEVIPGVKEVERKMIIECDGHDYHERTKDQAKKDRSRDRFLQSLGYLVFRYTGSEIWQDVFHCAHEALTTLDAEANKDIFGVHA
jgi:hypothetical protein